MEWVGVGTEEGKVALLTIDVHSGNRHMTVDSQNPAKLDISGRCSLTGYLVPTEPWAGLGL